MMTKNFTYNGWAEMPTIQAKEILTELIDGKENSRALLLISGTGMGKTYGVDLFCKKFAKHTYRVTVGDSWKPKDLADAVIELLSIKPTWYKHEASIRLKLKAIAKEFKRLKEEGATPILIIDESENLKPAFLKMIKELYDAIIKYCSIVLIGTPFILDSLLNLRNKNRMSVPQTYRRFKSGIRYISEIDKARDYRPFFDRYIKQYPDVQDLLLKHADNYGELHDYLDPLLRHCAKKGEEPSAKLFQFMHRISNAPRRR